MDNSVIVRFMNHTLNRECDIEVSLDITAQELFIALNKGLLLGVNSTDRYNCFFKMENPIAFLYGNKKLELFGVRNGSIIHFDRGDYHE